MTAARRIALATLIAGTLDIAFAAIVTAAEGRSIPAMLRGVASGPAPAAIDWGMSGSALGLAVHFAIMLAMAAAFIAIRDRVPVVRAHTLAFAALYGVVLWLIMNGLVLPARFGSPFPSPNASQIAKQLFAHIVLVGLPIGLIARRE